MAKKDQEKETKISKKLSNEKVNQCVDEAFLIFQDIWERFNYGEYTDDEFWNRMGETHYNYFYGFLQKNGLRTVFNAKSWLRFLDDFSLWSDKGHPNSSVGEPWLLDDNLDDHIEDKTWLKVVRSARDYGLPANCFEDEASIYDKSQFFILMKAFHITTDYFEPMPEGIIAPDKHWKHAYNDGCTYVIGYNCVDDNGLLSEEDPVGKTYTLKNDMGLKAIVKIIEDRRKQDRTNIDCDDFSPLGEYLAEGYIEGYTAIERSYPKIVIRTDGKGTITHLGTFECWKDSNAFCQYPLWQEYFEWCSMKENLKRKILSELFDSFTIIEQYK